MLFPSITRANLFDDFFDGFNFPAIPDFRDTEKKLYGGRADRLMKTDVHEHEDHYEVDVDLPGFAKDDIKLELSNGYLSISAEKNMEKKEENEGKVIRQERYSGSMRRSFFVGEDVTEEDIKAKYEGGVLSLNIPKKKEEIPEKKYIAIEG